MMERIILVAMIVALMMNPQKTGAFTESNVIVRRRPYQGVASMPVRKQPYVCRPRPVSRLLESRQNREGAGQSSQKVIKEFSIKEVTNRVEASEVWAFWNYSLPLKEYRAQNPEYDPDEALRRLTPFHNDQGQKQVLTGGEFVHFVAADPVTSFLAATVDVHRKEEIDDGCVTVELKNLRVMDQYRRRGIARNLVETVKNYAIRQCRQLEATKAAVFLHVELDNDAAIALYISQGFEFDDREECKMTWTNSCS